MTKDAGITGFIPNPSCVPNIETHGWAVVWHTDGNRLFVEIVVESGKMQLRGVKTAVFYPETQAIAAYDSLQRDGETVELLQILRMRR